MKTKKKPVKNYEYKELDTIKLSEPAVACDNSFVLNLDETKRYTYADYLTWLDDKRRELINGFIRLMSPAPSTKNTVIML